MHFLDVNWYSIFYYLTVSDGLKEFFEGAKNLFTGFAIAAFILMIISMIGKVFNIADENLKTIEEENKNPYLRAWERFRKFSSLFFYIFMPLALFCWIGYIMIPTKKDCLFIIAGGAATTFISTDSNARKVPSDIFKFVHLRLNKAIDDLNPEDKKELGLQTPKNILLDKAKNLTKEELIQYLQNNADSALKLIK